MGLEALVQHIVGHAQYRLVLREEAEVVCGQVMVVSEAHIHQPVSATVPQHSSSEPRGVT